MCATAVAAEKCVSDVRMWERRVCDYGQSIEECLRKAEDCEGAAMVATNVTAKRAYQEGARQWREMAERAAAIERHLAMTREST